MIKIVLPANTVDAAVAVRDRVQDLIAQGTDRVYIGNHGVVIETDQPVRVIKELEEDGFIDG
jgi:hypothetical protein